MRVLVKIHNSNGIRGFFNAETMRQRARELRGRFIPTKRNQPASDFYAGRGFSVLQSDKQGPSWVFKPLVAPDFWYHLDSPKCCKRRPELKVNFEELRGIAADIFRVGANRIHRDSSPETIESWDSLQHLNLILALEQKFGLEFEPEEIERMTSIDAIFSIIEEKELEQR